MTKIRKRVLSKNKKLKYWRSKVAINPDPMPIIDRDMTGHFAIFLKTFVMLSFWHIATALRSATIIKKGVPIKVLALEKLNRKRSDNEILTSEIRRRVISNF